MSTRQAGVDLAAIMAARALRLHAHYKGKVGTISKVPLPGAKELSIWYTPGVAEPCRVIAANADASFSYTNRVNAIAVVSDGSRVLGLGDIGPEAGLPVMEGKALLFKLFGGIDAVPLCIRPRDPEDIIHAIELLEPSFGGINLEDIAQPKCFSILDEVRRRVSIPVWHDDQQGSATAALAAVLASLEVTGKSIDQIRLVLFGVGAANVATYRLLKAYGVNPKAIVACDSKGILHPGRDDIERQQTLFVDKWRICLESNGNHLSGGPAAAFAGADICIAFSRPGPGVILPDWVRTMARDAAVFAAANPLPEIFPQAALDAGARIVATGRGDFPNQLNNSLVFPGLFRGVLDVRAKTISDGMAIAAAKELVTAARQKGLTAHSLLPPMTDWRIAARIAGAVGEAASSEGLARNPLSRSELEKLAIDAIGLSRACVEELVRTGLISSMPK